MTKGWKSESARHSMARRGLKTGRKKKPIKKRIVKTSRENASLHEVTGSTFDEVKKMYNWTDEEVAEFLDDHELNTCDKCNIIYSTYDLVWLTAEDFEPKKGEKIPKELYKKYDALCEDCYQESIKKNTWKFERKFKGASGSKGKHIIGDKYSNNNTNLYIGKNESIRTNEKYFVQAEPKKSWKPIKQNWFKTEREARAFARKEYKLKVI